MTLLVLLNSAAGTAVVRLTAPYHGLVVNSNTQSLSGCRAHESIIVPAGFKLKTGFGGFVDSSSAAACPMTSSSTLGSSSAYAVGETIVYVHVPILKSGARTVTAHWMFAYSGSTKLRHGSCPAAAGPSGSYCSMQAEAYLYVDSFLYDATNGSYAYTTTYWPGVYSAPSWTKSCYSTGCSVSSSGGPAGPLAGAIAVSMAFSATLMSGHHYYLETIMYGGSYSSVSTYGLVDKGGYAAGVLNFGLYGTGATLVSVVVT